jgi:hypothetical protein
LLQKEDEARRRKKIKKKRKEQARKSRKRAVKRNRKFVESYKIKNPCSCGEIEPCALSFHHNNGNKSANVSDMVNRGYSVSRLQKEINKCILMCLNCHSKFHHKEKEKENVSNN